MINETKTTTNNATLPSKSIIQINFHPFLKKCFILKNFKNTPCPHLFCTNAGSQLFCKIFSPTLPLKDSFFVRIVGLPGLECLDRRYHDDLRDN